MSLIQLKDLITQSSTTHVYGIHSKNFFLYDNQGRIAVIMGQITAKIPDHSRKICDLKLPIQLQNPQMHLIEISNENGILMIIGGTFNGVPQKRVYIFDIQKNNIEEHPLFKMDLNYPRASPVIVSQEVDGQNLIFIIGGNNGKSNIPKQALKDSIKYCEMINVQQIYDYKKQCYLIAQSQKMVKDNQIQNNIKLEIISVVYNGIKQPDNIPHFFDCAFTNLKLINQTKHFMIGSQGIFEILIQNLGEQEIHIDYLYEFSLKQQFCNQMICNNKDETGFYAFNQKNQIQLFELINSKGQVIKKSQDCNIY